MNKSNHIIRYTFLFSLSIIVLLSACVKDLDRDKFIGIYSVEETCGQMSDAYDLTINESSAGDEMVTISNLYNWKETIFASIDGNNITFKDQQPNQTRYSGSGTIDGLVITLDIELYDGTSYEYCTLICTMK